MPRCGHVFAMLPFSLQWCLVLRFGVSSSSSFLYRFQYPGGFACSRLLSLLWYPSLTGHPLVWMYLVHILSFVFFWEVNMLLFCSLLFFPASLLDIWFPSPFFRALLEAAVVSFFKKISQASMFIFVLIPQSPWHCACPCPWLPA